jgi:hypothetical protein
MHFLANNCLEPLAGGTGVNQVCRKGAGVDLAVPMRRMPGPRLEGHLPPFELELEPHWEPRLQYGIGLQTIVVVVLGQ